MKDVAQFFKVLADEARLDMVWLLMNFRELCVCDFIEVQGITQSKASRHLRTLYSAGLVDDRREGAWVYYTLRPQTEPLTRAQLAALKRSLAARPGSNDILERCASWRENRGSSCPSKL
jgi:DNA-binding transcriptional ArsR family regulator